MYGDGLEEGVAVEEGYSFRHFFILEVRTIMEPVSRRCTEPFKGREWGRHIAFG